MAIGVFIDVAFSILPGIRTAPICGGSSSLLQYSGMLQMAVHRLNSNGVLLRNWFHAFWKLENSTQCSKCFLAMGTQNDPPLLSTVWLNIPRVVLKATPYWILYDVRPNVRRYDWSQKLNRLLRVRTKHNHNVSRCRQVVVAINLTPN